MNLKTILAFTAIALFMAHSVSGQVGIGTDNPQNTLHVVPEFPNEDPLKIENLNEFMVGDSAFLVVDPESGIVRYLSKNDVVDFLGLDLSSSGTNEIQNASEVPLEPNIYINNDSLYVTEVQTALEVLFATKIPKGTYKSIAEARGAGLVDGDSFYTHPQGVFGCSGCIITLYEGM